MGWKNLSYWLKGGILGFVLLVLYFPLALFTYDPFQVKNLISFLLFIVFGIIIGWIYGKVGWKKWNYVIKGFMLALGYLVIPPLAMFHAAFYGEGSVRNALMNFYGNYLYVIVVLIIGVIIGWIYGKIKNKKR